MRQILVLIAFCASLVSVSPVLAGDCPEFTAPEGVTLLSEKEIREKIIGNTGDDGNRSQFFYYPDGPREGRLVSIWGPAANGSPGPKPGKWTLCGNVLTHYYEDPRGGNGWTYPRTISLDNGKMTTYKPNGKKSKTYPLIPGKSAKYKEGEPESHK